MHLVVSVRPSVRLSVRLCVCLSALSWLNHNHGAYTDNSADAVDRLLFDYAIDDRYHKALNIQICVFFITRHKPYLHALRDKMSGTV